MKENIEDYIITTLNFRISFISRELFRIETSANDRRNNPEVRKLNRFLKRNRRKVNRIIKLQRKVMEKYVD